MNLATVECSGVYARTMQYATIPAGIVGASVTFVFQDPVWDHLTKTAVFRGNVTRDVIVQNNTAMIPQETVATEGDTLLVGIYGVDTENNLVIPTIWTEIGWIHSAADPSGDPATDPDLPVWAQLTDEVENLKKNVSGVNGQKQVTESFSGGDTANVDAVTALVLHGKNTIRRSSKNLCSVNHAEVSAMGTFEFEEIPAGTYTISFWFTTTDTDSPYFSVVILDADDTVVKDLMLERAAEGSRAIGNTVADRPFCKMNLYASYGWANSQGDTAVYEDIMIESGWTATEYEPYASVEGISAEVSFDDLVFSADTELFDGDTVDFVSGEVIRGDGTKETVAVQGDVTVLSGTYTVAAENTVDITYSTIPYVCFTAQKLTEKQKAQVRENIGVVTGGYFNPPAMQIPGVPCGTIIDNCQDTAKWQAILGTMEADVSDYLIGTQSIRFHQRIRISGLNVPIENKQLRIKFKIHSFSEEASSLLLYVTNDGWTTYDYAILYAVDNASLSTVKIGEWVDMVIPLSAFRDNGKINTIKNITEIQLSTSSDNCSISLQQISVIDTPVRRSVVSFTFDDGYVSNFTKAAPILGEFGIPATAYIIPDSIEGGSLNCLSEEQVSKLKHVYGWDIECHLAKRLDEFSKEELPEVLYSTKRWIQDRGLGSGDHFAYPEGYFDDTTEAIVRKFFATARTVDGIRLNGFDSLHIPNPRRIRAVTSVGNSTGGFSVTQTKALIDRVAASGGWLILVFHHIDDENAGSGMYCSSSSLREIAQYVVDSGVEIRTVADAVG